MSSDKRADTTRVPQAPEIAKVLGREIHEIKAALKQLAANKVLILAPNDGDIWAANPFCAVPSGFRVHAAGKTYWAICIWDPLGIAAALRSNASIVHYRSGISAIDALSLVAFEINQQSL